MTTTEPTLFDVAPLVHRPTDALKPLAERWSDFHADNPAVADVLEQLCRDWFAAGNERCGMKAVAEIARWQTGLAMPGQGWKINNSFVAFYAREMLRRNPEWADRILLRVQKAAA